MKHAKGKLRVSDKWIQTESGHGVAYFGLLDMDAEDARRLVACWNACEAFETESLEAEKGSLEWITNVALRNRELREERDELVKALRDMAEQIKRCDYTQARNDALAILARYPDKKS